jgi:xanthine dehydrogenase accessory factor
MNEISRIINAFDNANKKGRRCALATIVKVEGSSYRQPGARMLVEETGALTGAISGGCLEGDALRKAQLAMIQQQNKLIAYDSTGEDDTQFGVQLGCNGIVYILIEPLSTDENEYHPIHLLRQLNNERKDAVIGIVCSMSGTKQTGTCMLFRRDIFICSVGGKLQQMLFPCATESLENRHAGFDYAPADDIFIFTEYIAPPVHLVIAGAGNDAQPLAEIAAIEGWNITVADGRQTHATVQRFPKADRVIVTKPESVLKHIQTDAQTVFVLMTHNYNYDIALLKELLKTGWGYIGILGPRKKYERMLDDLEKDQISLSAERAARIHAPVGLDIGAETPGEIALSIAADIKAVLCGRNGAPLKEKRSAIHAENN